MDTTSPSRSTTNEGQEREGGEEERREGGRGVLRAMDALLAVALRGPRARACDIDGRAHMHVIVISRFVYTSLGAMLASLPLFARIPQMLSRSLMASITHTMTCP